MTDNTNHKAPSARTACQICRREFCDPQTSVEDLAECYRLGYERLRATLTALADALEGLVGQLDGMRNFVVPDGGAESIVAAYAALRSIGRQS